jgi:ubiquinone/menaquinone biosynthesis C-methylase UbiE
MIKDFYNRHKNFSCRTLTEYNISPGIKCKFDLLKANINTKKTYNYGIDLGASGNSFLFFLDNISQKFSLDIADLPLKQYINKKKWHPICGDLLKLPYRDDVFDFVSALDVIEHLKEDKHAIYEMSRILKKNGLLIITVPHRMKYYTVQDQIIGHFRRYEINQIIKCFERYNFKNLKVFGVYGQLMTIANIQSANPEKLEENLITLRNKYESNISFRKVWDLIVKFFSRLMKIDAKYNSLNKTRNIGLIFIKK